jgi:triacylglycerol lipase
VSALALVALGAPGAAAAPDPSPPRSNDFGCEPSAEHPRPVVLVHGLGATQSANWSYMAPRLASAGYCVFSLTYGVDPRTAAWPYAPGGVVRMEQSATELQAFVDRVLAATGAGEVDLVGHSEGTVMPRYYLERLGGAAKVDGFVALTPLWRGTNLGGLAALRLSSPPSLSQPVVDLVASFCGSCPQFLRGSEYLSDLNADGEAVPGVRHTSIVTRYDLLVVPYTSGLMRDGGRNIVLQRRCPLNLSDHALVAFDPVVLRLIRNALDPANPVAVRCQSPTGSRLP